jgi:hypothetical protein
MLYQLPTGKTVWLEVEDVLQLTKEDLQFLIAVNAGEHIHNPFKHASITKTDAKPDAEEITEDEEEEVETYYEEYFPDEFPDLLDDGIIINFED